MKRILALAGAAAMAFGANSQAATFTFDGNIANHNDVVTIAFSLDNDATNVRVWTDSFMSETNFDPITALWTASGNLISENDDDSSIAAGQTWYDSGFYLSSLAAGDYLFTVATFANFANGTTLADGFAYENDTPISLSTWCQPASHCGMGTYWRVNLDGVDSATNVSAVPLPAAAWLFGTGLVGLVGLGRRKSSASAQA